MSLWWWGSGTFCACVFASSWNIAMFYEMPAHSAKRLFCVSALAHCWKQPKASGNCANGKRKHACGTHLDPGRLAVHTQHVGSSPHTMLSALADIMKHFAPLRLSSPKLCMHVSSTSFILRYMIDRSIETAM